ncbi:hypothetical protein A7E78_06530 [Syntrophotalea acetylenivorans]|uniref:Stage 0 sporulation protein A homolog n=2 Tax=Syntrophotalea acetylenivorans TaxID=1842532 RepID=A0A1L3GSW4_9BACT|nr:hypothetical protein A7E78_06530 [Syntrophotalea acetylenivorans]
MEKECPILLISEDSSLAAPLVGCLEGEGFAVCLLKAEALEGASTPEENSELILVDLTLPSLQRLAVCRTIRETYAGPLLVMADCVDEMHQVLGLEMGADDFIVKPISPALLVAKIRALLRRGRRSFAAPVRTLNLGALEVDGGRREVRVEGQSIDLTSREFDLLWYLACNARAVVSRDKIYEDLLGVQYNGYDRSVDIYISRIRQKLGDPSRKPQMLKTVRGVGYLLGG